MNQVYTLATIDNMYPIGMEYVDDRNVIINCFMVDVSSQAEEGSAQELGQEEQANMSMSKWRQDLSIFHQHQLTIYGEYELQK